jgi:hypothetical protein
MRTITPGPVALVVVPPAVAVIVGTPVEVPELTGAPQVNPPQWLLSALDGWLIRVTVPYVTPAELNAGEENVAAFVGSPKPPNT